MVNGGQSRNANLKPPRRVVPVEGNAAVDTDLLRLRAADIGMKPHLTIGGIEASQHNRTGMGSTGGIDGGHREDVERMPRGCCGCGQLFRHGLPDRSSRFNRQAQPGGRIGKTCRLREWGRHARDHTVAGRWRA